jgi:hypothetical protein
MEITAGAFGEYTVNAPGTGPGIATGLDYKVKTF